MAGAGGISESELVYISLPKVSLLIAVLFSATVSVLGLVSQYTCQGIVLRTCYWG